MNKQKIIDLLKWLLFMALGIGSVWAAFIAGDVTAERQRERERKESLDLVEKHQCQLIDTIVEARSSVATQVFQCDGFKYHAKVERTSLGF